MSRLQKKMLQKVRYWIGREGNLHLSTQVIVQTKVSLSKDSREFRINGANSYLWHLLQITDHVNFADYAVSLIDDFDTGYLCTFLGYRNGWDISACKLIFGLWKCEV